MAKVNTALQGKRQSVLVRLQQAQEKYGCLPEEVINEVAQSVGVSVGEVYGVATFYSFLSTRPLGRSIVRVCKSLPCHMKNSAMVIDAIHGELGIRPGETTSDGKFSLELTNCIGACDKAPAMLVNSDLHGDLTPEKIARILKSYR